jgi:hypothetical protein
MLTDRGKELVMENVANTWAVKSTIMDDTFWAFKCRAYSNSKYYLISLEQKRNATNLYLDNLFLEMPWMDIFMLIFF